MQPGREDVFSFDERPEHVAAPPAPRLIADEAVLMAYVTDIVDVGGGVGSEHPEVGGQEDLTVGGGGRMGSGRLDQLGDDRDARWLPTDVAEGSLRESGTERLVVGRSRVVYGIVEEGGGDDRGRIVDHDIGSAGDRQGMADHPSNMADAVVVAMGLSVSSDDVGEPRIGGRAVADVLLPRQS